MAWAGGGVGVVDHADLENVQFDQHHDHYARYIKCIFEIYIGLGVLASGRVEVVPIQVPFTMTLDRVGLVVGGANGNVRGAIYADNGDLPDGGALLVESASIAAVANKDEITIANTQLTPGIYWLALQLDDNTLTALPYNNFETAGGTLQNRTFNQVYGAFPNPCPVTAGMAFPRESPWLFARVASVP